MYLSTIDSGEEVISEKQSPLLNTEPQELPRPQLTETEPLSSPDYHIHQQVSSSTHMQVPNKSVLSFRLYH